jgi:hypothetical protein
LLIFQGGNQLAPRKLFGGGSALHPALVADLKLNASIQISSLQVLCRQLLFSFGFDTQKKIFNGLFSSRENSKRNLSEWEKLRRRRRSLP